MEKIKYSLRKCRPRSLRKARFSNPWQEYHPSDPCSDREQSDYTAAESGILDGSPMTVRTLSIVTTTDPLSGQLATLACRLRNLELPNSWRVELIVVDDLSLWPDARTARAAVATWADEKLSTRAVWYPEHRGQLRGLHAGIQAARGEAILTIDPDMHGCCAQIPDMLAHYQDGKIIHGSRLSRPDATFFRRNASVLLNRLISWLADVPMQDIGSPILLFPARLRQELEKTAAAGAHPTLYLYQQHGQQIENFFIDTSEMVPRPSHYRLFPLCILAIKLVRQCLTARRYSE